MKPHIPNPQWPIEVKNAFEKDLGKTPFGCGTCSHSEWHADPSVSRIEFVVSLCRAGVLIPKDGEAKEYCTQHQSHIMSPRKVTANPVGSSGTEHAGLANILRNRC